MNQRGFATIFGLCMILAIALVVKGIQEAETNHAREVANFQTEQALQGAAESGIVEAAELVRETPSLLPEPDGFVNSKIKILDTPKTFKRGGQAINISVEVWGERGNIYINNAKKGKSGVYFMSTATTAGDWGKIYRRAYAYILKGSTAIRFMELP